MIDEALIKVAKELDELKEERVEYTVSNVAYKYEIECLKKENEALKTCIMTDHHKIHALVDIIDEVYQELDKIDAWLETSQASHLYKAKDLLKEYVKEK